MDNRQCTTSSLPDCLARIEDRRGVLSRLMHTCPRKNLFPMAYWKFPIGIYYRPRNHLLSCIKCMATLHGLMRSTVLPFVRLSARLCGHCSCRSIALKKYIYIYTYMYISGSRDMSVLKNAAETLMRLSSRVEQKNIFCLSETLEN